MGLVDTSARPDSCDHGMSMGVGYGSEECSGVFIGLTSVGSDDDGEGLGNIADSCDHAIICVGVGGLTSVESDDDGEELGITADSCDHAIICVVVGDDEDDSVGDLAARRIV